VNLVDLHASETRVNALVVRGGRKSEASPSPLTQKLSIESVRPAAHRHKNVR
jgi:hypothetical protein